MLALLKISASKQCWSRWGRRLGLELQLIWKSTAADCYYLHMSSHILTAYSSTRLQEKPCWKCWRKWEHGGGCSADIQWCQALGHPRIFQIVQGRKMLLDDDLGSIFFSPEGKFYSWVTVLNLGHVTVICFRLTCCILTHLGCGQGVHAAFIAAGGLKQCLKQKTVCTVPYM